MLRITELRKSFGSLVAVDGVSLSVARGEVFGLLGPNGAGKSTTIGMAIGLLAPDSGSVELEGFGSPRDPAARRQIGVAPQSLALYDELSGEENLLFFGHHGALKEDLTAMENLGFSAAMDGADFHETSALAALHQFGLKGREELPVRVLSAGQKRRVMLARLAIRKTKLWILDEPFTALDVKAVDLLATLIADHVTAGGMAVLTSHQTMPIPGGRVVQL